MVTKFESHKTGSLPVCYPLKMVCPPRCNHICPKSHRITHGDAGHECPEWDPARVGHHFHSQQNCQSEVPQQTFFVTCSKNSSVRDHYPHQIANFFNCVICNLLEILVVNSLEPIHLIVHGRERERERERACWSNRCAKIEMREV